METGRETREAVAAGPAPERVVFLGCPVHRLTVPDTLEWMAAAIAQRVPRLVVSLNAYLLHQMAGDERLRAIVQRADLVAPEWAIVWGAGRLGLPSLGFVPGVLVVRECLKLAAARGFRVYLLGARPEVVATLAERMHRDLGLQLAGFHHGYFDDPSTEARVIDDIRRARPDVLFAALGAPKQEYWLHEHRGVLNVPVVMGVGGSFDVLSGFKRDTPAWARGNGLEWLYRTWQDPRAYWKRYLVTNTWFVAQVARARLAQMRRLRRDAATG
jgi:N-acetylglucosaminyldiphosphoundecaprenol N-acetyl-beta-D-mannosaminyltransferase